MPTRQRINWRRLARTAFWVMVAFSLPPSFYYLVNGDTQRAAAAMGVPMAFAAMLWVLDIPAWEDGDE